MNYFLAGAILAVWLVIVISLSWVSKARVIVNLGVGIFVYVLMGVFYYIPFWLIFLKS